MASAAGCAGGVGCACCTAADVAEDRLAAASWCCCGLLPQAAIASAAAGRSTAHLGHFMKSPFPRLYLLAMGGWPMPTENPAPPGC